LGDYSPKKKMWGFFLKNVLGIFETNIWIFKVLKGFFLNLGWQHCFHPTVTFHCKVLQNARNGEPHTFLFSK
jgi:hypothetical protein